MDIALFAYRATFAQRTKRNEAKYTKMRNETQCDTQLIVTLNDLLQSYDQNKQTDVVILDFSKAFDIVPHDKLMYKLEKYGKYM
jgi:tRNA A58 N-methylase Trm61